MGKKLQLLNYTVDAFFITNTVNIGIAKKSPAALKIGVMIIIISHSQLFFGNNWR